MSANKFDPVNRPEHYNQGIEVIDVTKCYTKHLKGNIAFAAGNVIKYACRWSFKGKPIEDLKKVIWYCNYIIKELENEDIEGNMD